MKKLLPILIVLLFAGCDFRTKQQRADKLAENYLNNKYANADGYAIINNGKVDTIFTADTSKAAKLQKPAKRTIKGWYFYTSYITKSRFGVLASHHILIVADADCNKILKVTETSH